MSAIDSLKEEKISLTVLAIVAAVGLWFSQQFVWASDYKMAQQAQTAEISYLRVDQLILQRDALSDQLFDLEYRLRDVEDPHPDDLKRLAALKQAIIDVQTKMDELRKAT